MKLTIIDVTYLRHYLIDYITKKIPILKVVEKYTAVAEMLLIHRVDGHRNHRSEC